MEIDFAFTGTYDSPFNLIPPMDEAYSSTPGVWIGTPVPIPSSIVLFATGRIGVAGFRRKLDS